MDPRIQLRLASVSKRLRSVRTGWSLAWLWLLAALSGWCLIVAVRSGWLLFNGSLVGQTPLREWLVIGWLASAAALGLALALRIQFRRPDYPQVVQRIERHFPDLEQRLLTASQISVGSSARPVGYLQRCVVSEAIHHDVQRGWLSLISSGRMASAWLAQTLALLSLLATAWLLWTTPENVQPNSALASVINSRKVAPPIVEPGDAEIERGSSLIVTARFKQQVPDEVWLMQASNTSHGGAGNTRLRMRPSLEDPIFAAYLTSVNEPLDYHIEYGKHFTPAYHVDVFDVPALVRADAELVYPSYARQSDRSVLDTRRITVPAGTQVTWKLQLNKAVAVAELISADGVTTLLVPLAEVLDEDVPATVTATLVLQESQQWLVRLVDAQGRSNTSEIELQAKVLPNEPAKIQLLAGGDARVSPLEELDVSAKVNDDHAITAAGIAYQFGGREVIETLATASNVTEVARLSAVNEDGESSQPTLASQEIEGNQRQVTFSHHIDLERLEAQPNQLLSYYVWAEDVGPDGQPRRTVSDIYFAEVRPFEEIFREGQQPTGDQQQQQQQAGDPQTEVLMELQKQIVVATWNLLRTHRDTELPKRVIADLDLLAESQQSASQLLQQKSEEVQDAQLQTYVEQASQSMLAAIDGLTSASKTLARAELESALSREQSAYEALLQLQSREHQVVRGQQSQSASSSSPARQAQIEQLALSNDENRYENQRLAQSQEEQQQSESRQINSRLRELAARQQDLNQELRELQAALQTAQTADEQEELERRLQRLREQQQQMLADSDELNERMQNPSNESMQEAQAEMQQARNNMQRATEAMRQDKPGEALAAGARAEQQMQELQESLRKQSANQFQQSMQEMQQQAAELEERQNQLAQQLRGQPSSDPTGNSEVANNQPSRNESSNNEPASEPSQSDAPQSNKATRPTAGLRGAEPTERQLTDQVRKQQSDLQELLQQMEETVNEAEAIEPLLAQRLYDSYRRMQQDKTLERLQVTERLIERNLQQPASELAQTSAEELTELRQQIDRAADAVLGSDVESLRLALNKLETLTDDLDGELPASMSPDAPPSESPTQEQPQPASLAGTPQEAERPAQGGQPQPQGTQSNEPLSLRGGQPQSQPGPTPGQQSGQQSGQPSGQPGEHQQSRAAGPSAGPLTGNGFRAWSDTLRDVEELVGDAELRWQATEIRQSARELRTELKKHAAEPQWEAVQELVASPLRELKHKVANELIRRAADKTQIVPLDRDPVPSEFSRSVRQYFENLGSGQ